MEIAKKLDMEEKFTEGKTIKDLEKQVFENMEIDKFISWEEFEIRNTLFSRLRRIEQAILPV